MDRARVESISDKEEEELTRETSAASPFQEIRLNRTHFPGIVRKKAYKFDGQGRFCETAWDLVEGKGNEFCWYHVELPKGNHQLSQAAKYLIGLLCPPLKLQDILSLVSNGPFCGYVDGALIFRVNSPGPPSSDCTFRIAARVVENLVITVSLGRVPRLGFSKAGQSLLYEVPSLESPSFSRGERKQGEGIVIKEHVLEFFLKMNHSEEADNPVPKSVSNLVVHIIDTHVDHIQDVVTKLEMELDTVELELDTGGFALKKEMLDERRFPKMHLDLQRLLQVIAHGEQVFPRVKEKCSSKTWFANEDIASLDELIGRLRRLKENVGFIANRVTAIQAGLDSWQAERINRKLYYLSFLSIIFLPLSIITGGKSSTVVLRSLVVKNIYFLNGNCGLGYFYPILHLPWWKPFLSPNEFGIIFAVFGMNVGGVPWTEQKDPALKDGFRNVILLCVGMLFVVLLCFIFPWIYTCLSSWRRRRGVWKGWSVNRSFLRRHHGTREEQGGYLRI